MPGGPDFHEMLRELAQQHSALSQQQAALFQVQTESLRLQRMLIERAMVEAQPEGQLPDVIPPSMEQAAPERAPDWAYVGQNMPIADVPHQPAVSSESPSDDQPRRMTRRLESRPCDVIFGSAGRSFVLGRSVDLDCEALRVVAPLTTQTS